jgi:ferrous iron transport protein A
MQLAGNKNGTWEGTRTLMTLRRGEQGVLAKLNLPEDVAYRLMLLGFVPGAQVEFSSSAPGGDPRVFRVEGTEVAMRRETAEQIDLNAE